MVWEVLETDGQSGKDERWRERQTPRLMGWIVDGQQSRRCPKLRVGKTGEDLPANMGTS